MQHIAALNNTAVRFLIDGLQVAQAERSLLQAMQWLNQVDPKQQSSSATPAAPSTSPQQLTVPINKQSSPVSRRTSAIPIRRSSASSFACVPSDIDYEYDYDDEEDYDDDDSDIDMGDHSMYDDNEEEDDEEDDDDYEAPVQSIELTKIDPSMGCIHNVLPLYNRALVLSYTAQYEEVAACVLFNLALIYHIRGMNTQKHQKPENLQKALKLYELAVKILQRQSNTPSAQQQQRLVDELLVLALFYNMGHASTQLFANSQANAYFSFLRQVLRDSTDCYGVDALQDEDQSFFFFNAMLFQGEQMTLAPAA